MYERYYGLRERPFDLAPNPRFLFLSDRHREALAHLRYGLTRRFGLTAVMGEAGTGKTTLVKAALKASNGSASGVAHLSNPTLTRVEFFEYLTRGFGFRPDVAASKTQFLRELECKIASRAREGAPPLALIVDEAHCLPHELLEEIRLLTNIEVGEGQSLAVALVGQPELTERLEEGKLWQLKQRVVHRCELIPFGARETATYIAARVRIAGGQPEQLFTRDAVVAIHRHSKGIPRTISVICDNALVSGLAAGRRPVGPELVLEVCRDFRFSGPPSAQPMAGPVRTVAPAVADRQEYPVEPSSRPVPVERRRAHSSHPRKRFRFFRTG
jgi:general secretion pathway protein A